MMDTQATGMAGTVDGLNAHEWRDIAHALWQKLDNIDTLSDAMRPEQTDYYKAVMKIAEQRHGQLVSDGYELYPHGDAPTGEPVSSLQSRFDGFKRILTKLNELHMRMENAKLDDDRTPITRQIQVCTTRLEDVIARWNTYVLDWRVLVDGAKKAEVFETMESWTSDPEGHRLVGIDLAKHEHATATTKWTGGQQGE